MTKGKLILIISLIAVFIALLVLGGIWLMNSNERLNLLLEEIENRGKVVTETEREVTTAATRKTVSEIAAEKTSGTTAATEPAIIEQITTPEISYTEESPETEEAETQPKTSEIGYGDYSGYNDYSDFDDYGDFLPPYEATEKEPPYIYENETLLIPFEGEQENE